MIHSTIQLLKILHTTFKHFKMILSTFKILKFLHQIQVLQAHRIMNGGTHGGQDHAAAASYAVSFAATFVKMKSLKQNM